MISSTALVLFVAALAVFDAERGVEGSNIATQVQPLLRRTRYGIRESEVSHGWAPPHGAARKYVK